MSFCGASKWCFISASIDNVLGHVCRRKALTKERSLMQSVTFLATKLGVHCLQNSTAIMPMQVPAHFFFSYKANCLWVINHVGCWFQVLGHVCYHIIAAGLNGYMATVTNLKSPVNKWRCGAAPISVRFVLICL